MVVIQEIFGVNRPHPRRMRPVRGARLCRHRAPPRRRTIERCAPARHGIWLARDGYKVLLDDHDKQRD